MVYLYSIIVNDETHQRFLTAYLFEDIPSYEVWLHILNAYVLFEY